MMEEECQMGFNHIKKIDLTICNKNLHVMWFLTEDDSASIEVLFYILTELTIDCCFHYHHLPLYLK